MTRETLDALVIRYLGGGPDSGHEEAAEEIVRRTRRKLLSVARRIGSPQDAEDAVHTAYLSLHHRRGGALDAPVMPWLVTAVVRIAYRHKAREQRRVEICRRLAKAPSAISPPVSPPGAASRAEEIARLRDRVDRLPAKCRDAVVLHYLQGLSTSEVASLLGISRDAVKKRLQRSRALLRGTLSPWIVYPLLMLPWLLADAFRGSGALVLASTGGIMKAKSTVILATITFAAGTVGYGAAILAGARPEPPPSRADSGRNHERSRASLALLDQVARLEERARTLEDENRALRSDPRTQQRQAGTPTGTETRSGSRSTIRKTTDALVSEDAKVSELIKQWRARVLDNPDFDTLKQGGEVLRKTREFRAVEQVYREQLRKLDEQSAEGRLILTQLGHLHRDEGKYTPSDLAYQRLRDLADPRAPEHAEAIFQLAWNQRFQKNWDAAIRLFDDAGRAPGATRQTAAIARYNYAQLLATSGDATRARSAFDAMIREFSEDKSATTRYYVSLARAEVKRME